MAVCYRHPDRETGVSCSNCERPICTDCMTTTPVGMRCPECSKQKTKVLTTAALRPDPIATYVLIAINALAYFGVLASGGRDSEVYREAATLGIGSDGTQLIGVAEAEYWRLLTGGFMHDATNPLHILFNMYILYWLGTMLEPSLGRPRYLALYFTALLGGSLGAIILDPLAPTVGASGAVFGLMGAAFVIQRSQGIDPMQSGIGMLLILNLGLSFVLPGISVGGHIGGLVAGALAGLAIEQIGRRTRSPWPAAGACAAIAVVCVVGAILAANAKKTELGLDAIAALL